MSSMNSFLALRDRFPHIVALLGGWFDPYERERKSDEEIVTNYALTVPEERERVLVEAREFLRLPTAPWDMVSDIANIYFKTEAETKAWFLKMLDLLEKAPQPKWLGSSLEKHIPLQNYFRHWFIIEKPVSIDQVINDALEMETEDIEKLLQDIRMILKEKDLPKEAMEETLKLTFKTETEARKWLENLVRILEETKKRSNIQ